MTTLPSTRAPGITSCIRLSERRKVDFPQPEGPISAVTARGSMETVTSYGAEGAVEDAQVRDVDALGHGFSPDEAGRSATGLGGEDAADQPGDQVEQQDDDDEHQSGRPGPVDAVLRRDTGLRELVVRVHGQGGHAAVERV